jgi:hypothetical protein
MGDIRNKTVRSFEPHDIPQIPSDIGKFPPLDSEEAGSLCLFCRNVDFRKVLDINPHTLRGRYSDSDPPSQQVIAHLGRFSMDTENPWKLASNSCALCLLIQQLSKVHANGYHLRLEWSLTVTSFFEGSYGIKGSILDDLPSGKDTPFLTLDPSGGHCPIMPCLFDPYWFCLPTDRKAGAVTAEHPLLLPQILPLQVDFTHLRQWLSLCQSKHGDTCQPSREQPTRMKLIDCGSSNFSVIHAPFEARYAALSYVWGRDSCRSEENGSLPRTVTDAITATKALGLRYLWVDKYCIDQSNHAEKHEQIMHMDMIYKASQVTIMAAGGDDANAGLPGVGNTPRNPQPLIKFGDVTLVSSMSSPRDIITDSKWHSRGWVLQESFLPTRRLAFTEDQVYLECNSLHCQETIMLNFPLLSVEPWCGALTQFQMPGIFCGNNWTKQTHRKEAHILSKIRPKLRSWNIPRERNDIEFYRLQGLIENYTTRDLTYDSDSLIAFSGILSHFTQQYKSSGKLCGYLSFRSRRIHHIYGIPFLQQPNKLLSRIAANSFVVSLSWSHDPASDHRCRPVGPAPRERIWERGVCPSWSWAAWAGEVFFHNESLYVAVEKLPYVARPWLEVEKRKTMSPVDAARALGHTRWTSLSNRVVLRLETYMLTMNCLDITFKSEKDVIMIWRKTPLRLEGTLHMSKSYQNEKLRQAFLDCKFSLAILYFDYQCNFNKCMVIEEGLNHSRRVGVVSFRISAAGESGAYDSMDMLTREKYVLAQFLKECCIQRTVRII